MNVEKATAYLNEEYLQSVYNELNKNDYVEWSTSGTKALLQFAFQIFVSILNGYVNDSGNNHNHLWLSGCV